MVEQERGMLLYKGGAVCHDRFNENSANAICKELGYSRSLNWTSGYHYNLNFQFGFHITLDDVECDEGDWGLCSYSTSNDCYHLKDVFLSCVSGGTFQVILCYFTKNQLPYEYPQQLYSMVSIFEIVRKFTI